MKLYNIIDTEERTEVLDILHDCKDVSFFEYGNERNIRVTIEDFEGFDEDWNEQMVEYDEDEVDRMERRLAEVANEVERGFYDRYYFDDFTVTVGYASYDI